MSKPVFITGFYHRLRNLLDLCLTYFGWPLPCLSILSMEKGIYRHTRSGIIANITALPSFPAFVFLSYSSLSSIDRNPSIWRLELCNTVLSEGDILFFNLSFSPTDSSTSETLCSFLPLPNAISDWLCMHIVATQLTISRNESIEEWRRAWNDGSIWRKESLNHESVNGFINEWINDGRKEGMILWIHEGIDEGRRDEAIDESMNP